MKNLYLPWFLLPRASAPGQSETLPRLLNAKARIGSYVAKAAALMLAAPARLRTTADLKPWADALPKSFALSPDFEGNR